MTTFHLHVIVYTMLQLSSAAPTYPKDLIMVYIYTALNTPGRSRYCSAAVGDRFYITDYLGQTTQGPLTCNTG